MDERIQKWLYDILKATSEIDSFFNDEPKIFININQISC